MRRRTESLFFLIERTVPMLFAIGAVLSILSLFFRAQQWLFVTAVIVWCLTLIGAVMGLVFSWIVKKNKASESSKESVSQTMQNRLSEVAHELKTPLTVIRGSVEVLADGAVSPEQYPEYFDRILRETDAMAKLVSDLLEATRKKDALRFDPEVTDLAEIARCVVDDLRETAADSQVHLEFSAKQPIPLLMLDPHRIGQLAIILLDNAVKHSSQGGTVFITLSKTRSHVLLSVKDEGTGIASEDLPHIFERYYRAPEERGGRRDGTGIGLCVAKQIAELHGGTIDVKSRMGKGTLFTVRFPLSKCKVE